MEAGVGLQATVAASCDTYMRMSVCRCRRGWTTGQSFPDCLCGLMAFDDVSSMQPCKCVPGGVHACEPCMPPASLPTPIDDRRLQHRIRRSETDP